MKRKIFMTVFLACLLAAAGGCIFEPREPQEPGEGEEDCWQVPTQAKIVFSNLECGFRSLANSSYMRSISEDYMLVPRDEDRTQVIAQVGSDVYEGWNKDAEEAVLTQIKGDYAADRSVRYGDAQGEFEDSSIEGSNAWFKGEYLVVLKSGGQQPDTLSGIAFFHMEKGSQGWVMTKWEDFDINGPYPTVGYFWGITRGGS